MLQATIQISIYLNMSGCGARPSEHWGLCALRGMGKRRRPSTPSSCRPTAKKQTMMSRIKFIAHLEWGAKSCKQKIKGLLDNIHEAEAEALIIHTHQKNIYLPCAGWNEIPHHTWVKEWEDARKRTDRRLHLLCGCWCELRTFSKTREWELEGKQTC